MRFKPNLSKLTLNHDSSIDITVEFIPELSKDPYAHTVILSSPDKRLWTVKLEEMEKDNARIDETRPDGTVP